MPPGAEAAADGALSIEDAVAALDAAETEQEAPAEEAPQAAAGGDAGAAGAGDEDTDGAASAPEDNSGDADETRKPEGEEEEEGERAETPLEPPLYWKPEAKAKFAALDPELQAEILAQEGPREAAASKAKAEAAEIRTQAEAALQDVSQFAERLKGFLPQAVQTFRSRWGDQAPDWVKYAQEHGAEAMSVAKAAFEAERTQLQELATATQEAETKAFTAYVEAEFKTLQTLDPELADPEKGAGRRKEVVQYLVEQGVPREAIRGISAVEMVLAKKARLWDQAQAKAKAAPKPAPKDPPPTSRPLARGAAAAGASDPKAKATQTAKDRFTRSGSISDAVAFLDALED